MKRLICLVTILLMTSVTVFTQLPVEVHPDQQALLESEDFEFVSDGLTLSGIIDQPIKREAKALIIFVHGYGNTNVRDWNMYSDLRARFAELGIATATWDKPGQGRSEGEFDINQPVHESAQEVLDAAAYLRAHNTPGADNMGIWGISRAGWIAPIAMSLDDEFEFWISVSGVTAEDNYFYYLMSNLPYEGGSAEEAEMLAAEWKRGFEKFRTGKSYEDYLTATENLRANAYITERMGGAYTQEQYEDNQAEFLAQDGTPSVDMETGMTIHVQDFDEMLFGLDIDVLALFGEKDLNVDWRKTKAFYATTIGQNPDATLRTHTFPDANHNIDVAKNGSIREMQEMQEQVKSEGYYNVQIEWLREYVLR